MKYNKFVGEKALEISYDEANAFTKHISNILKENNLPLSIVETTLTSSNIYYGAKTNNEVIVKIEWDNWEDLIGFRNKNKDNIRIISPMLFRLTKTSGYLDETDWATLKSKDDLVCNYKDAPVFQYSCHTITNIDIKPYRKKTWSILHRPDNVPCYFYGTEFSDMEILDFIKGLVELTQK